MENQFDLIVIGAGPGGYVCAIRASQLGMKVACIESRESLGGTCLNVGCIPSKAILESTHHYAKMKEMSEHGIDIGSVSLNLGQMVKRKDKVVQQITEGVSFLFKKNKITWLKGTGSFLSNTEIKVTGNDKKENVYSSKYFVIATGSVPIALPKIPFDQDSIIDSTNALSLKSVPKHLMIVGGGVIGLELGSAWCRLGAKVSIIEATNKILPTFDQSISSSALTVLQKQGLTFYLSTKIDSATKVGKSKSIQVNCKNEDKDVSFEGDKLLICIGRKPNTESLNLSSCGVNVTERGFVTVNKHFATNVDNIFAIGDVIGQPMLAHKAEEEGVAVAEILAGQKGHVNYIAIPNVVYTWPEIASVGLSEEECQKQNLSYSIGKFNFKANGRAKAMGESDGFVKILADSKTDKLLGVHIFGANASELIGEAVLAFEYGASSEDLARSVHAHPTLCESIKEAALDVAKRAIHS